MIFSIISGLACAENKKSVENKIKKGKEMKILLNRLNLNFKGLEKVKAKSDKPDECAKALLKYFKKRKTVKHPVISKIKGFKSEKTVSKKHLEIADDAVKNILIASPSYPRHDFGKKIDWSKSKADNEWLWQLHRHSSWGALARIYVQTGKEKYAKAYARQLADWLENCSTPKKLPKAWRTIEMGIRGRSWTSHFLHFIDSPSFTPELLVAFLNSAYDHAEGLTNRHFKHNNWGLMEAEGAAFIAFTFPEFKKSEQWIKKCTKHISKEVDIQVRADGHQVEQCINYHVGCINWFARTAELAKINNKGDVFSDKFWKRLEAMVAVLMQLGLPNGETAQFGDTHSPVKYRSRLDKWGHYFNREDFLYSATGGKQGKAAKQTTFALKDSGFYSMRSDWSEKATCLVLNCGPHGGWHDQPHNGTFELFANGKRLTPDSGSYIYSGNDKARTWFKQTAVHQTLTLNLKNASQEKHKLILWKPGKKQDIVIVENNSYKGLKHRRAIIFVDKKFFVLVDEAIGTTTGKTAIHFQLAPGEAIYDKENLSFNTGKKGKSNLLIQSLSQKGLSIVEEKGWVSYKYTKKVKRPAFRIETQKKKSNLRFITVLVPYVKSVPKVSIQVLGKPKIGSSEMKLKITLNDKEYKTGYSY